MMGVCRVALVFASLASVAAVVACGYSGQGSLDGQADPQGPSASGPASGDGSTTSADASTAADGAVSAPVPICNAPGCAVPTPPAGWELVLLGSSRADPCPAGFDSADSIESPVAGASACACAACVVAGTDCATGGIPTAYDSAGGACGSSGAQHQTNGGLCRNTSGTFGQDARVDAPTAGLGTCTSASSGVPANVVTQLRRVCTRQASTCGDHACGAPASMQACIASPGDVACPTGVATKHLVGSDFTLACPSCGCSVTSATCGGAMDFYPQPACAGAPVTLAVGVCTATGAASFQSTKWRPLIAGQQCATVPAAPTTTLTAAQTICCP